MKKKLLIIIPAALIILAAAIYGFANYRLKSAVDLRISDLIESGDYLLLEYDSVGFKNDGAIEIHELHVIDNEDNEFILDTIRIADFDYFNPIPHYMNLTASGVHFPEQLPAFGDSPDNPLNIYLGEIMQGDFLPLSFNYRYDYKSQDGSRPESQLDSIISIELPESFSLTGQWMMKNIPIEQLNINPTAHSPYPANISGILQNADIPTASIALQDFGMVNALMTIQGDSLGMNSAQYRVQLQNQLQAAALFIPQQMQSLAQDVLGGLNDFMEGGNTFRLSVTPEYGGNIQQLQGEIMAAFYIGNIPGITELLHLDIEVIKPN